jgi:hypothetical protein
MATSPTNTLTPKKKEESFLDKLGGTLARKKKAKEGSMIYQLCYCVKRKK